MAQALPPRIIDQMSAMPSLSPRRAVAVAATHKQGSVVHGASGPDTPFVSVRAHRGGGRAKAAALPPNTLRTQRIRPGRAVGMDDVDSQRLTLMLIRSLTAHNLIRKLTSSHTGKPAG